MGSQQALVSLLSHSRLFWVAVINAMTKANLEEERFISPHTSMSQSIAEDVRSGQVLKQKSWGNLLPSASTFMLSRLSYTQPRNTGLGSYHAEWAGFSNINGQDNHRNAHRLLLQLRFPQ